MTTKAKLCFIGAGFHAQTNIFPAAVEAGAEIKAIATRNLERSKAALLKFGSTGTPYDSYEQMLKEEECDGVVVVAQPADQMRLAMECIRAGKNVYVDKPLGWNAEEASEVAKAAKEAGVVAMVGFMKRYAPIYMKLKELINDEKLGAARSFEARFAVDSTPFCKTEDEFMKLVAIHFVDLIRFLFGEVVQVSGFSNNQSEHISQALSVKCANGVVGSVFFSGMTAWTRESERMMVTFDHGFASAEEVNTLVVHHSSSALEKTWQFLGEQDYVYTPSASAMSGAYRDLYVRGFVGEMAHFMECCQKGQTPVSSAEDNIGTMELCDRILSVIQTSIRD
ncbi:Gfo/Idh/MocA family protein [Brevibacillus reuszeri]|uniref:Gfo/Idh/MocA family protein n=1 Tax=Brevibacillus reuszeri TaxID=54915 RepID=UPI0028A0DD74|nr:Gfo/Idh/MocA family oxidoreductase [Brevibacillus reuszeri]